MKKTPLYKVNKFLGQMITAEKCPDIRWDDVVKIEALGTDVVSAFAIMITFHYSDGSSASVHPEQKGYYQIVESLDERFSGISPDWFAEMQESYDDWPDVHRVLYSVEKKETP
jgi:hypothetical protein